MDVLVKTIKFRREQYMTLGAFHDDLNFIEKTLRFDKR